MEKESPTSLKDFSRLKKQGEQSDSSSSGEDSEDSGRESSSMSNDSLDEGLEEIERKKGNFFNSVSIKEMIGDEDAMNENSNSANENIEDNSGFEGMEFEFENYENEFGLKSKKRKEGKDMYEFEHDGYDEEMRDIIMEEDNFDQEYEEQLRRRFEGGKSKARDDSEMYDNYPYEDMGMDDSDQDMDDDDDI